ncbi:MAG: MBL fold metallo-hydrolase, partial [Thermoleophilaceae bacterium]
MSSVATPTRTSTHPRGSCSATCAVSSRAPGIASARRLPPIDQVADGVFQLRGRPRNAVNVYLAGDVLIDAGTSADRKRILRELEGRTVKAHALTHAHPDHFGSSHAVCERLRIPLWCGVRDAPVVEGGRPAPGQGRAGKLLNRLPLPKPHPVERRLNAGDQVAGFTVLDVPGHSPGHVAYWREADRTLICGDVLFNLSLPTLRPGLREPYAFLTPDPAPQPPLGPPLGGAPARP